MKMPESLAAAKLEAVLALLLDATDEASLAEARELAEHIQDMDESDLEDEPRAFARWYDPLQYAWAEASGAVGGKAAYKGKGQRWFDSDTDKWLYTPSGGKAPGAGRKGTAAPAPVAGQPQPGAELQAPGAAGEEQPPGAPGAAPEKLAKKQTPGEKKKAEAETVRVQASTELGKFNRDGITPEQSTAMGKTLGGMTLSQLQKIRDDHGLQGGKGFKTRSKSDLVKKLVAFGEGGKPGEKVAGEKPVKAPKAGKPVPMTVQGVHDAIKAHKDGTALLPEDFGKQLAGKNGLGLKELKQVRADLNGLAGGRSKDDIASKIMAAVLTKPAGAAPEGQPEGKKDPFGQQPGDEDLAKNMGISTDELVELRRKTIADIIEKTNKGEKFTFGDAMKHLSALTGGKVEEPEEAPAAPETPTPAMGEDVAGLTPEQREETAKTPEQGGAPEVGAEQAAQPAAPELAQAEPQPAPAAPGQAPEQTAGGDTHSLISSALDKIKNADRSDPMADPAMDAAGDIFDKIWGGQKEQEQWPETKKALGLPEDMDYWEFNPGKLAEALERKAEGKTAPAIKPAAQGQEQSISGGADKSEHSGGDRLPKDGLPSSGNSKLADPNSKDFEDLMNRSSFRAGDMPKPGLVDKSVAEKVGSLLWNHKNGYPVDVDDAIGLASEQCSPGFWPNRESWKAACSGVGKILDTFSPEQFNQAVASGHFGPDTVKRAHGQTTGGTFHDSLDQTNPVLAKLLREKIGAKSESEAKATPEAKPEPKATAPKQPEKKTPDVVDNVAAELARRGESAHSLSPTAIAAIAKKLKVKPEQVKSAAAESIARETQRHRDAQPFPVKPIPEDVRQRAIAEHLGKGNGLDGSNQLIAPEQDIPLSSLHATQPSVNADHVNDLASGRVQRSGGNVIDVLHHDGKHHIWEGHHAAAAAALRGDKNIRARVLNMDQAGKPEAKPEAPVTPAKAETPGPATVQAEKPKPSFTPHQPATGYELPGEEHQEQKAQAGALNGWYKHAEDLTERARKTAAPETRASLLREAKEARQRGDAIKPKQSPEGLAAAERQKDRLRQEGTDPAPLPAGAKTPSDERQDKQANAILTGGRWARGKGIDLDKHAKEAIAGGMTRDQFAAKALAKLKDVKPEERKAVENYFDAYKAKNAPKVAKQDTVAGGGSPSGQPVAKSKDTGPSGDKYHQIAKDIIGINSVKTPIGTSPMIPDIYDQLKEKHPDLTEKEFHDVLRRMERDDFASMQEYETSALGRGDRKEAWKKHTGHYEERFPNKEKSSAGGGMAGGRSAWIHHPKDAAERLQAELAKKGPEATSSPSGQPVAPESAAQPVPHPLEKHISALEKAMNATDDPAEKKIWSDQIKAARKKVDAAQKKAAPAAGLKPEHADVVDRTKKLEALAWKPDTTRQHLRDELDKLNLQSIPVPILTTIAKNLGETWQITTKSGAIEAIRRHVLQAKELSESAHV
jgi:hypothetical protein